jgi:hypothetical protein
VSTPSPLPRPTQPGTSPRATGPAFRWGTCSARLPTRPRQPSSTPQRDATAGRPLEPDLAAGDRILVQLAAGWEFVVLTLVCLRARVVPVMAVPAHRHSELSHVAARRGFRALSSLPGWTRAHVVAPSAQRRRPDPTGDMGPYGDLDAHVRRPGAAGGEIEESAGRSGTVLTELDVTRLKHPTPGHPQSVGLTRQGCNLQHTLVAVPRWEARLV